MQIRLIFTGWLLALVASFSQPGYAYIDPGTGSVVLQVVIATVAGGLLAIKMFWSRIRKAISERFSVRK